MSTEQNKAKRKRRARRRPKRKQPPKPGPKLGRRKKLLQTVGQDLKLAVGSELSEGAVTLRIMPPVNYMGMTPAVARNMANKLKKHAQFVEVDQRLKKKMEQAPPAKDQGDSPVTVEIEASDLE